MTMLKSYKTEILPSEQQALKIRQTLGICRYLHNLYLASNFEVYETLGSGFFVTAFTFDKYVNHVLHVMQNESSAIQEKTSTKSQSVLSEKCERRLDNMATQVADSDNRNGQTQREGLSADES